MSPDIFDVPEPEAGEHQRVGGGNISGSCGQAKETHPPTCSGCGSKVGTPGASGVHQAGQ